MVLVPVHVDISDPGVDVECLTVILSCHDRIHAAISFQSTTL